MREGDEPGRKSFAGTKRAYAGRSGPFPREHYIIYFYTISWIRKRYPQVPAVPATHQTRLGIGGLEA
jgi:hypothetical protein